MEHENRRGARKSIHIENQVSRRGEKWEGKQVLRPEYENRRGEKWDGTWATFDHRTEINDHNWSFHRQLQMDRYWEQQLTTGYLGATDEANDIRVARHRIDERFRQELPTARRWRVDQGKMSTVFQIWNTDPDGVLDQDEYKEYLECMNLWGTQSAVGSHWYTDETWDESWQLEVEALGCTDEGITWEAFLVLYAAKNEREENSALAEEAHQKYRAALQKAIEESKIPPQLRERRKGPHIGASSAIDRRRLAMFKGSETTLIPDEGCEVFRNYVDLPGVAGWREQREPINGIASWTHVGMQLTTFSLREVIRYGGLEEFLLTGDWGLFMHVPEEIPIYEDVEWKTPYFDNADLEGEPLGYLQRGALVVSIGMPRKAVSEIIVADDDVVVKKCYTAFRFPNESGKRLLAKLPSREHNEDAVALQAMTSGEFYVLGMHWLPGDMGDFLEVTQERDPRSEKRGLLRKGTTVSFSIIVGTRAKILRANNDSALGLLGGWVTLVTLDGGSTMVRVLYETDAMVEAREAAAHLKQLEEIAEASGNDREDITAILDAPPPTSKPWVEPQIISYAKQDTISGFRFYTIRAGKNDRVHLAEAVGWTEAEGSSRQEAHYRIVTLAAGLYRSPFKLAEALQTSLQTGRVISGEYFVNYDVPTNKFIVGNFDAHDTFAIYTSGWLTHNSHSWNAVAGSTKQIDGHDLRDAGSVIGFAFELNIITSSRSSLPACLRCIEPVVTQKGSKEVPWSDYAKVTQGAANTIVAPEVLREEGPGQKTKPPAPDTQQREKVTGGWRQEWDPIWKRMRYVDPISGRATYGLMEAIRSGALEDLLLARTWHICVVDPLLVELMKDKTWQMKVYADDQFTEPYMLMLPKGTYVIVKHFDTLAFQASLLLPPAEKGGPCRVGYCKYRRNDGRPILRSLLPFPEDIVNSSEDGDPILAEEPDWEVLEGPYIVDPLPGDPKLIVQIDQDVNSQKWAELPRNYRLCTVKDDGFDEVIGKRAKLPDLEGGGWVSLFTADGTPLFKKQPSVAPLEKRTRRFSKLGMPIQVPVVWPEHGCVDPPLPKLGEPGMPKPIEAPVYATALPVVLEKLGGGRAMCDWDRLTLEHQVVATSSWSTWKSCLTSNKTTLHELLSLKIWKVVVTTMEVPLREQPAPHSTQVAMWPGGSVMIAEWVNPSNCVRLLMPEERDHSRPKHLWTDMGTAKGSAIEPLMLGMEFWIEPKGGHLGDEKQSEEEFGDVAEVVVRKTWEPDSERVIGLKRADAVQIAELDGRCARIVITYRLGIKVFPAGGWIDLFDESGWCQLKVREPGVMHPLQKQVERRVESDLPLWWPAIAGSTNYHDKLNCEFPNRKKKPTPGQDIIFKVSPPKVDSLGRIYKPTRSEGQLVNGDFVQGLAPVNDRLFYENEAGAVIRWEEGSDFGVQNLGTPGPKWVAMVEYSREPNGTLVLWDSRTQDGRKEAKYLYYNEDDAANPPEKGWKACEADFSEIILTYMFTCTCDNAADNTWVSPYVPPPVRDPHDNELPALLWQVGELENSSNLARDWHEHTDNVWGRLYYVNRWSGQVIHSLGAGGVFSVVVRLTLWFTNLSLDKLVVSPGEIRAYEGNEKEARRVKLMKMEDELREPIARLADVPLDMMSAKIVDGPNEVPDKENEDSIMSEETLKAEAEKLPRFRIVATITAPGAHASWVAASLKEDMADGEKFDTLALGVFSAVPELQRIKVNSQEVVQLAQANLDEVDMPPWERPPTPPPIENPPPPVDPEFVELRKNLRYATPKVLDLKSCKALDLRTFALGNCRALAEGLDLAAERNAPFLEEVHFWDCGLCDFQARCLLEAFEHGRMIKLTTLLLDGNKIGPVGAQDLGDGLKVCEFLRELSMAHNPIGIGALAFAKNLRQNMVVLNLSQGDISDVGAVAMGQALPGWPKMSALRLAGNKEITIHGAEVVTRGVLAAPSLKLADMHGSAAKPYQPLVSRMLEDAGIDPNRVRV